MCARFLGIIVMAVAAVTSAQALPICTSGTLSDFIAFGTEGCAFGDFTLKNFDWRVIRASSGYDALEPNEISASILGTEGLLSVAIASNFVAVGSEFVSYRFSYLIDPPPVIIRGFEEDMETFTPRDGGVAQINSLVCAGGLIEQCANLFRLRVFHDGQNPKLFDSVLFLEPVNMVDIQHLISLDANGGLADFSSFTGGAQIIPEPMSITSFIAGLTALLVRRRSRA